MKDALFTEKSKSELLDIVKHLTMENSALSMTNTALSTKNTALSTGNKELTAEVTALLLEKRKLEELLRLYQHRQFGRKSEKWDPNQLSLFDEAALPKKPEAIEIAEQEIQIPAHARKIKVGRKPLPEGLPRIQQIYDLPDHEKICPCGCALTHITDDITEQLELIPAKVYVVQHVRKKYACKACEETIKVASAPPQPIPRSIASPGLLSHVVVSKFQDHLPLHRQEVMLRRIGVDIPRSTLSLWVLKVASLLAPLKDFLKTLILNYDVAYGDETTVQVIKESKKPISTLKYMWLFMGGPPEQFSYYYHYHPSRAHAVPLQFFEKFRGYLHCDGYGAYDALSTRSPEITLVGCWYHARRKFFDVTKLMPNKKDGIAHDVLKHIQKLSFVEEAVGSLAPEERWRKRDTEARPILEELKSFLFKVGPQVPPKSALGQAISYTMNQWPKLLNYLSDGRLEISNNRSERAIKPFAIGRKGWLFAHSIEGAEAAATLFSFVETCKHHRIEPYDWFRYVFEKLPLCKTDDDRRALLPFNIDRELLKRS